MGSTSGRLGSDRLIDLYLLRERGPRTEWHKSAQGVMWTPPAGRARKTSSPRPASGLVPYLSRSQTASPKVAQKSELIEKEDAALMEQELDYDYESDDTGDLCEPAERGGLVWYNDDSGEL